MGAGDHISRANTMTPSRISINILLFISVLYFPWWLTILIGILLLSLHNGVELLFWGLFADALFGVPLESFYGVQYLFTLLFFILIVLAVYVKQKMIFYN